MVKDIFQIRRTLKIEGKDYSYCSLPDLQKQGFAIGKSSFFHSDFIRERLA